MFVSKLAPTVVLTLLSLTATAAPQLSLTLNKTETQLGKPVRVELEAVDAPQPLSALDLQPLRQSFGVVVEESMAGSGQTVQRLRLRLYPRRTGELTLPALRLGELQSAPQTVHVTEGPITVTTHLSEPSPWQRQQVMLQLDITTPDLFASLAVEGELKARDVDVVPLPLSRERRGTGKVAVLRLGWALSPLTAGTHNVELPPIRYELSGRTERIYYFPAMPLPVRPLPPYIPPTLPVGKVSVTSTLTPGGLLSPDTLAYWTVTVSGETVTPRGLPPLLRQVQSSERVRFLSVESERTWDAETQRSRVVHHIPVKPLASGRLSLPSLQFQYFDPGTGRLVRVTHTPPRPWVLGWGWRAAMVMVPGLPALWLCLQLYRLSRRAFRRRREQNAALMALKEAADARQLRRALEAVSHAEGFPANLSLREWARHWRAHHHADPAFDPLVARLSRACYGKPSGQEDSADMNAALYALYRQNRGRWFFRAHGARYRPGKFV